MALPGQGDLVYGGAVFGSLIKSTLKGDPVEDDARLTTKYVKWTLSVRAYVTAPAGDTNDAQIGDLATILTTKGSRLQYRDKGGPTFDVNAGPAGQQDVLAGPSPKLLKIDHIGSNLAALVEWECEFALPMCDDAVFRLALQQLNYTVSFERDEDGYTTRRIVISAEIPQQVNRGANPTTADTIDNYFERILPAVLPDFTRKTTMNVAQNKARCELTVEDTENPVPKPNHASQAPLVWKVSSKLQGQGFVQWNASLSGSVRMMAGLDRGSAWSAFLITLASRLEDIDQQAAIGPRPAPRPGAQVIPPGLNYLITGVSIEEEVYGKDGRFSVELVIFQSSRERIIRDSGLWRRIRGTDRLNWSNSRPGPRGNAGLRHRAADVVIDLCRPRPPEDGIGGARERGNRAPGNPPLAAPDRGSRPGKMDPKKTWLLWFADVEVIEDNHVAVHRPIGGRVDTLPLQFPVAGDPASPSRIVVPDLPPERPLVPNIIQQVGNPSTVVVLRGRAVRVQYKITPPRVAFIGGVPARQMRRRVRQVLASYASGVPVYACVWEIWYAVDRPNQGPLPVPANPFLGAPGNA